MMPPAICQRPDHLVAQITAHIPHLSGVGVGRHKGARSMLDHIPEPSVRKVGNIYHHAQLVHSLHGFKAKGLEPLILEFRGRWG